ncbi:MAG: ATPase, T2SS/T4P/T4SS family [Phycisphaerales bacterium]|jgi:type IV pilus assembly protein PilB|nr:ATPase, T2SS/T4P/T4SS family [Phycisphaerales bacterium]
MPKSSTSKSKKKKLDPAQLKGRRFGRVLTKLKKVTREQVHESLSIQKVARKKGDLKKLGEIMLEMGIIQEQDILQALSGQAGFAWKELDVDDIPQAAFDILPVESATTYQIVPVDYDENTKLLTIALKSPDNFRAVDDLRLLMGFKVTAVVSPSHQIDEIIKKRYSSGGPSMADMMADLDSADVGSFETDDESTDLTKLASAASDNKIVRLINLVLLQAIKDKASDIHFEPFEEEFKMRYRIDGILYEMVPPPMHLAMPIVSRIKIMANLDISERRLPQDGRIELTVGGSPVDLRVSILPTMYGESVVLRVLDRSNVQLSMDKIGLRTTDYEKMSDIIKRPNGIVLVTGPTGSGKTTTLYSALSELNEPKTKILTAEDPVEYDIDGLVQCQVNTDQELTFAKLLRSFLRQDPDVILVGEIRDLETAQIAVQASLTGHLVFTTLHTNDAPSTVLRMVDLGVESFLITATVEAIVAQRLVRRICNKCKEEYKPSVEELMELRLLPEDVEGRTFFRGKGCDSCNGSGYRGRLALFEIMEFDDTLRELILSQASTAVLRVEASKRGMRSLRESGLLAIYDGQTTIDEVVRETMIDE